MKTNQIDKYLKQFQDNGFVEFNELLDKKNVNPFIEKLLIIENGIPPFLTLKKNFQKKQFKKTNPGKGKFNLAESFNLDFIEKKTIF